MPLQSLYHFGLYGEQHNFLPPAGWSLMFVSTSIDLDENGTLLGFTDIRTVPPGRKNPAPRSVCAPQSPKRGSNDAAGFLVDYGNYMLGLDTDKKDPAHQVKRFLLMKEKSLFLLRDVHTPFAEAIKNFFMSWDPETANEHPLVKSNLSILTAAGLTFSFNGVLAVDDNDLCAAWSREIERVANEAEEGLFEGICRFSGKKELCVKSMPKCKALPQATSNTSYLISYGPTSTTSYGREQCENSPIGKHAAHLLVSAYQYLCFDPSAKHHRYIVKDTTFLFWTLDQNLQYSKFFRQALFGRQVLDQEPTENPFGITSSDIYNALSDLVQGRNIQYNGETLDPNTDFYMIGLSPSSTRVIFRFNLHNSFGNLLKNVQAHYERLETLGYDGKQLNMLYPEELIRAVKRVPSNGKVEVETHEINQLMNSILYNRPYPSWLEAGVIQRVRIAKQVSPIHGAIIKALLLKNHQHPVNKEVTAFMLTSCPDVPYRMGQYLALSNRAQALSMKIPPTQTLADNFFVGMMDQPSRTFPDLYRNVTYHLTKLRKNAPGLYINLYRQLTDIFITADWAQGQDGFEESVSAALPKTFSSEEKLRFCLGYDRMVRQIDKERQEAKAKKAGGADIDSTEIGNQPEDPDMV